MNIIKKLKQVFCRHEWEKFVNNSYAFSISYEVCKKCGSGEENKIIYTPEEEKKYCDFSVVKGIAESFRLYKKYYDEYISYYKYDSYTKLLFHRYGCGYSHLNSKEIIIKNKAEKDAQDFIAIQDRIEMEKEEELRKLQVKIDLCYLGLPHE